MSLQYFVVDISETMAAHRADAADTVWALSKVLKSKPPRPGSIKLSILADTENRVHLLHASTKAAHIIRKFPCHVGSSGPLLGLWYVRPRAAVRVGERPLSHQLMSDSLGNPFQARAHNI
jgi:hypothetical protein